jgi:hypothetical protein
MDKFIVVPIKNREGKDLEPVRVNLEFVTDYRKWLNKDDKEQTVFFFDKKIKKKRLIADISVEEVDKIINGNGKKSK